MTSHVCRCGSSSLTALPILLCPSWAPCHLMVTTLYMLFFWELSVTCQPRSRCVLDFLQQEVMGSPSLASEGQGARGTLSWWT